MRRFLVFTLLYPPLALAVFTAPDGFKNFLDWLGAAYLIATILAWLTMAVDSKLSAKPARARIVGTTLAAAAMTGSIGIVLIDGEPEFFAFLMMTLLGAVPAAVCSWLSGEGRHDAVLARRFREAFGP